ncbi:hypothetical protein GCM10022233_70510 [Streptomyces shaanxiensis]|uniref:Amidinotransferase n=1 Tax=Streptomyces shaanxiensis TaxID=653357 RepID=A0ABP7W3L9_9ACTN
MARSHRFHPDRDGHSVAVQPAASGPAELLVDEKVVGARLRRDAEAPRVSPVNSHNEWDPLEEIIVGRLDGATIPSRHPAVVCNVPPWTGRLLGLAGGFKYPRVLIERAQRELDQFVDLLRSLGVTVRRPDVVDHRRHFGTPDWSSRGFCNTCPRDSLLVIGDEIIETPMA